MGNTGGVGQLLDGKGEVDACLEIRSGCCVHIDLANGDVATILIEDSEGVRCQQVIVDLLGTTAVLEDDGGEGADHDAPPLGSTVKHVRCCGEGSGGAGGSCWSSSCGWSGCGSGRDVVVVVRLRDCIV